MWQCRRKATASPQTQGRVPQQEHEGGVRGVDGAGESEVLDAWGHPQDNQLVEVEGKWQYSGRGLPQPGRGVAVVDSGGEGTERRRLAR